MPTIKKRGYAAKRQSEQQIVTLSHTVSDFVAAHRKNVAIIAAIVVAIVIIAAGYSLMRSSQESSAAPLVDAAYEAYSPSQGGSADYAKALDLFRAVQKKYPSTMNGAIAQFYIGNCLMNLGRNDEALKEYQAFASRYSGDKFLLGLVSERMGYLYKALGKQADAIKAFEQADSLIGPGAPTMELAKLYEAAGDMAKSQDKYKIISEKLAGTAWGMEAMGKVQKIASVPGPASAATVTFGK